VSTRKSGALGTPDLIVPLSRAYDIKADGFMPYQFDVAETNLTEDKWVTAYEVLPSARNVVHHVIIQVHEEVGYPGPGRRNGRLLGDLRPGNGAHHYPDGFARKIPAGARVSFQIHYTPSGQAKKERLRLGLVFAKSSTRNMNRRPPPSPTPSSRFLQAQPVSVELAPSACPLICR